MRITEPDKKILKLAEKWLNGTISSEEEKEFAEWYNSDQDSSLYIPASFVPDEETHRQRILTYINKARYYNPKIKRRKRRNILIAAAACVALLFGSFVWRYINNYYPSSSTDLKVAFAEQDHLIKKANTSGHTVKVVLPDSSIIQLGNNSQIVYSNNYNKNRKLYLNGSAVFDVKHNPSLPFEVHASQLITKVLGTKFKIVEGGNTQKVIVAVLEGKVSVVREAFSASSNVTNRTNEKTGFVLMSNQEVVFTPSSNEMQKSLVASPVEVHPEDKKYLQFEAAPLAEVFHHVGKVYGISIIFDASSLTHCTLTADLDKGSFYDKLDKICLATNLQYSEMDGHILISGRGCN